MRTFLFDSFMSFVALIQENNMSRFSDDAQGLNVIFSSLSLSGYAVTLEGVATTFFLFLGAYIVLEHNIRLLPREKFKFAISMVRQVHTPMVLSRNRLEEIMESGVSAETRRMLETVLKHIEHAIVSSRNIMQLDRGDWKAVSETGTDQVDIYSYVRMVAAQCQPYAGSHHVRIEVSHSEEHTGCRINEGLMTAALQHLLSRMIDITTPGGCIYITVSQSPGIWKLQAANYKRTDRKSFMPTLTMPVPRGFRTVGKMIRLHGGKVVICRHGKSIMCQIVVPTDCHCRKEMEVSPDIFFRKRTGHTSGEIADSDKKENSSIVENLPKILLVMTDNMFGSYLQAALSAEFNISIRENLDIPELSATEEKPDAIVIDENVNGTCGDELCSRIKADEMTAAIPVILLMEHDDSRSYLAHAESGADRLEPRTISICRLKTDICMLISSCATMCKRANRILADTVHMLPQTIEKEENNLLFIAKVRKLVEENLATQGYTINSLCTEMGMSRTSFYNRMKELTGKYPMEYVLTFKMERAKMLLASRQYNVTEVAEMLGYCDAKYFGKRFKAFYHTCPTKFIKKE